MNDILISGTAGINLEKMLSEKANNESHVLLIRSHWHKISSIRKSKETESKFVIGKYYGKNKWWVTI